MIRRLRNLWYWSGVDIYATPTNVVVNRKAFTPVLGDVNELAKIVDMSEPLEDFQP